MLKRVKNRTKSEIRRLRRRIEQFLPLSAQLDTSMMIRCWLSEQHVFPAQCFKHQLKNLGVTFYDYCLSGHWRYFYSQYPAQRLRVLDKNNANVSYTLRVLRQAGI